MAGAGHGAGKSLGPQLSPSPEQGRAHSSGAGDRDRSPGDRAGWALGASVGLGPTRTPLAPHPAPRRHLLAGSSSPPAAAAAARSHLEPAAERRKGYGPHRSVPAVRLQVGDKQEPGGCERAMDGGAWKPGSEAEQRGAVQACIDIPAPGRGRNPAGSRGTPESPGSVHCPGPIATGGRAAGRSCPAGPCYPCPGAGRHVPTCCRSQPKITTVPLPIRAAREACGLLLGSSSALQLDVREGGFSSGRAHPGAQRGRGAAGPGAHGPGRMQPPQGLSASRADRTLALAAPAGRMRARSWGPAGLAKAPAGTRPRHARAHALPRLSWPWTCPRLGGGS